MLDTMGGGGGTGDGADMPGGRNIVGGLRPGGMGGSPGGGWGFLLKGQVEVGTSCLEGTGEVDLQHHQGEEWVEEGDEVEGVELLRLLFGLGLHWLEMLMLAAGVLGGVVVSSRESTLNFEL